MMGQKKVKNFVGTLQETSCSRPIIGVFHLLQRSCMPPGPPFDATMICFPFNLPSKKVEAASTEEGLLSHPQRVMYSCVISLSHSGVTNA
eukprot:scaffold898_cov120-Skeletonema_marinoi.AAC.9